MLKINLIDNKLCIKNGENIEFDKKIYLLAAKYIMKKNSLNSAFNELDYYLFMNAKSSKHANMLAA